MPKINSLPTDKSLSKNDRLLGSDALGPTRNYKLEDVLAFIRDSNSAGVFGQLSYIYYNRFFGGNSQRPSGSMTIDTSSVNTAFDAVSTIKVSKYSYVGEDEIDNILATYLNKQVVIVDNNDPNNFATYVCGGVDQDIAETDFYNLSLTYINGEGSLTSGNVYSTLISPSIGGDSVQSDWNATSGGALILNKPTIPTDNSELTNGAGYITDGNTNWNNTYGFITGLDWTELGGSQSSINLSGFNNDSGFITSYTETDTLDSVTGRGNTTANDIEVGGLNVDTDLIYTDTVNGRVGIGTNSPTDKLTVIGGNIVTDGGLKLDGIDGLSLDQGGSSVFSPTPGIFYNGSEGWYFQVPNNGREKFNFKLGSTDLNRQFRVVDNSWNSLFQVQGNGNVLIGTTTDAGYKLDVNGNGRVKGSGTTSSTTALLVENSNSSASLEVLDNGDVEILNGRLVLQNGDNSVYIGLNAGANDDKTNNSNIGIGLNALANVTSGTSNVAIGRSALADLTTGNYNVAIGNYALGNNTTDQGITAIGYSSQLNSTSGRRNTSLGYRALSLNQTGDNNVVVGYNAQYDNSVNGVALVGYLAGENNSGGRVVGVGYQALQNNSGADNTALGYLSGYSTVYQTGSNNTFLGYQSTYSSSASNISNSTAVGANVSLTDSNTVILGNNANVGIGTTSPSYKLDVDGTARAVKSKIDFTPTSDTIALDIRGTGTPNDYFTLSNATGGANDVFLPLLFYKAATYGYNGGTNRYPSGVYGGGFVAAVDDSSFPSSAGAGAAMHFNSRAYANNGPLSNRYLFSWGSWLTTHMAMTAGGNLLIGTTIDSGYKLGVNGDASVSGDINADGDFYQNGTQGYTGTVTIQQPSPLPPINIDIQGGIITNVT